jgi:hypothetical protein
MKVQLASDQKYEVNAAALGPGVRMVLEDTNRVVEITGWSKTNPPMAIVDEVAEAAVGDTPERTVALNKGSLLAKPVD